jgi:hypothetical protein
MSIPPNLEFENAICNSLIISMHLGDSLRGYRFWFDILKEKGKFA